MLLTDIWFDLSAVAQDAILLAALLLGPLLMVAIALLKYRLFSSVAALLRHHWQAAFAMIGLIAIATSINLLTSLQSSSLVTGTARAADPFDLIVAAPGNDIDILLSVVYLQSSTPELLDPTVLQRLQQHESVEFAAPVGFGDRLGGYPVIGTTPAMLSHLAGYASKSGTGINVQEDETTHTGFGSHWSVIPGANANLIPGTSLHAQHGDTDLQVNHTAHSFKVQAALPSTGTPWDHAALVPIAALWALHGQGEHDVENASHLTPGVPAVVVKAESTGELYTLRQEFNNSDSMAFFPAEVLARLYGVMSSVGNVVRWITLATQVLVVSAVLLCAFLLMRSLAERFRMLHAIGAPYGYRFSMVWLFVASLIIGGTVLGLLLGWSAAVASSLPLSQALSVTLLAQPALHDFISTAVLLLITLILAVVPVWVLLRRA